MFTSRTHAHPLRRSLARRWPSARWKSAGALALLCSTVTWASFPRVAELPIDQQHQWQAIGVAPLSSGGVTGVVMAPSAAVQPLEFAPKRAASPLATPTKPPMALLPSGPLRISGQAGDGLYWSLRAAGANPQVAAEYLAALATEIDVGEVAQGDRFDLVLGNDRQLLYAGLNRPGAGAMQLVKWASNGGNRWIDAADVGRPQQAESGMMMPVAGHITSYFGYRYHPILHFVRFHAGVDIGAGWGSPIVAAGDGQVVGAGWAGGYGRQVAIAHAGGLVSSYSHMSEIVAAPGSYVHQGQLIGYVGSSGLSTGPHLHFEVKQSGTPVNPLGVRLAGARVVDTHLALAVKARLKALLGVGARRS